MQYELAVVGLGAVGSAALLAAARRGISVVGIEQFGAAHNLGSSHGQSRIIRQAYFEHPDYVPMARRSMTAWREIEAAAGVTLMTQCGLLQIGRPDSEVIRGVQSSSALHDIPVERFAADEIENRWNWWRVPADCVGLFEPGAGLLRVEKCVAAMLKLARESGGKIAVDSPLEGWDSLGDGSVELRTKGGTISARSVIFACGSWSAAVLNSGQSDSQLPALQVQRVPQLWFHADSPLMNLNAGGFCWLVDEGPGSCFYGLPGLDHLGMKVARHGNGDVVDSPDHLNRTIEMGDRVQVEAFMQRWFRFRKIQFSFGSVCMYTMSPDQHFLVDRLPGERNIFFAAGLSGHGFKFAPVLGEALVEMTAGRSDADCEFLGLKRFGKRDEPAF